MSLCDKCFSPGHCCKSLRLSRRDGEDWIERTFWTDEPIEDQLKGLPFTIAEVTGRYTDPASGREYATMQFDCSRLLPTGRCGDYENRPQICRDYEPQSDSLCVHYQGAEGTGEGL